MNRIEKRLEILKEKNEKALITYITAGLPTLEKTVDIIKAQSEAGVDVIELGIPFSDPVADGPVIQNASYKSICQGTTLVKVFDVVSEARKTCEVPIVFMMYYNTIVYYGIEKFIDKCIEIGVDGLIVPDLPFEEQFELKEFIDANENAPILIQLVSPVSKARVPMLLENARGFVYCVSSMGVTGQAGSFHKDVKDYLDEVRSVSKIPVMMGFGIRTAKDVEKLQDEIDGCIVGSAFITLLEDNNYDLNVVKNYISTFKQELN